MAGIGSKKTQFKKGQGSANPFGRPLLPKELKEAKKLNRAGMELAFNLHISSTQEALEEFVKDKSNKVLDLIIASMLLKAIKEGDHYRLNFLLDRLIGKVKDEVEVIGAKPTIIQLLNNKGQIILGSENDENHSRDLEQFSDERGLLNVNKASK